jgi:hypothetical protein
MVHQILILRPAFDHGQRRPIADGRWHPCPDRSVEVLGITSMPGDGGEVDIHQRRCVEFGRRVESISDPIGTAGAETVEKLGTWCDDVLGDDDVGPVSRLTSA